MFHWIFLMNCCVPAARCYGFKSDLCGTYTGLAGECMKVNFCQAVNNHISRVRHAAICPYGGHIPIACCELQQRIRQPFTWQRPHWEQPQYHYQNPVHYTGNTFQGYNRPPAYQKPQYPVSIPTMQERPPSQALAAANVPVTNKPNIAFVTDKPSVVSVTDKPSVVSVTDEPNIATVTDKPNVSSAVRSGDDKEDEKCPPIPDYAIGNNTKTGRKALDKCLEYVKYVFPCNEAPFTDTGYLRDNDCIEDSFHITVVGGNETQPNQYPHMVVLGFGGNESTVSWKCGGTLISEYFVMTAGHCTFHRDFGSLSFARFGAHKISDKPNPDLIYKIAEIIKNGQYKSPSKYHDIALLRMDRRVKFSRIVRPACLNVEEEVPMDLKATGWGVTETGGDLSDVLMEVDLKASSPEQCKQIHQPTRTLKSGIDSSFQICAGDPTKRKDTCQGDSGGPLQFHSKDLYCTYNIVGITSFGKSCGTPGVPGVYTRVSYYVPWIESVVWP